MRFLLEALPAIILLGIIAAVLSEWQRRRALRRAGWRSDVRSLEGRIRVEVARRGEPTQVVAELDPGAEGFDTQLYEAQARADNLAATLNAARRPG